MSSALHSQTPREHDELVKYEYNLASCYEAEYLLSLKLQEEMMRSRSNTGDSARSAGYYDDGYEVQAGPGRVGSSTLPLSQLPPTPSDMEAMETASCADHMMGGSVFQQEPPSGQYHATRTHSQPVSLVRVPEICRSRTEDGRHSGQSYVSNAWSLPADMDTTHSEGPARKKICLHQTNSTVST